MTADVFSLKDKRALVIGGATGMGAAVAQLSKELGAAVAVMDVVKIDYPTDQSIQVDLREKSSVDSALAELSGNIDIVYACAGVADGTAGLMLINFISQRHIIDALTASGRLNNGGSIIFISSVAGLPLALNRIQVEEFLSNRSWDDSAQWIVSHEGTDNYSFSKQAICAFVESNALPLLKQGIRINSVMPGPTDTPLARANADVWLGFGQQFRSEVNVEPLAPAQIASTMAFFASDAASGVNGINMLVDYGHVSSAISGVYDEPAIKAMTGTA